MNNLALMEEREGGRSQNMYCGASSTFLKKEIRTFQEGKLYLELGRLGSSHKLKNPGARLH